MKKKVKTKKKSEEHSELILMEVQLMQLNKELQSRTNVMQGLIIDLTNRVSDLENAEKLIVMLGLPLYVASLLMSAFFYFMK